MTVNIQMVGADVSKLKLDIALDDKQVVTVGNQETDFKRLIKCLPFTSQTCFVMESTGGYERVFVHFLLAQGIKVCVVNAKRARDYTL